MRVALDRPDVEALRQQPYVGFHIRRGDKVAEGEAKKVETKVKRKQKIILGGGVQDRRYSVEPNGPWNPSRNDMRNHPNRRRMYVGTLQIHISRSAKRLLVVSYVCMYNSYALVRTFGLRMT